MIEFGNENKQLSFLNETITNIVNNSYDFKIFRETSITNVQIKPDSNIALHITMGVLKGFLSQTFKIFTESSFLSIKETFIQLSIRISKKPLDRLIPQVSACKNFEGFR